MIIDLIGLISIWLDLWLPFPVSFSQSSPFSSPLFWPSADQISCCAASYALPWWWKWRAKFISIQRKINAFQIVQKNLNFNYFQQYSVVSIWRPERKIKKLQLLKMMELTNTVRKSQYTWINWKIKHRKLSYLHLWIHCQNGYSNYNVMMKFFSTRLFTFIACAALSFYSPTVATVSVCNANVAKNSPANFAVRCQIKK